MAKRRVGNDLGEVRRCRCGGIRLELGPTTMHFEADEVPKLLDLVRAGADMTGARGDTIAHDDASDGRGSSVH